MKKLILGASVVLFFAGAVLAQEKTKDASCCKKSATAACCKKDQAAKGSACCKQPSKTAALRTVAAKPAKPAQTVTAAAVKPSGK